MRIEGNRANGAWCPAILCEQCGSPVSIADAAAVVVESHANAYMGGDRVSYEIVHKGECQDRLVEVFSGRAMKRSEGCEIVGWVELSALLFNTLYNGGIRTVGDFGEMKFLAENQP